MNGRRVDGHHLGPRAGRRPPARHRRPLRGRHGRARQMGCALTPGLRRRLDPRPRAALRHARLRPPAHRRDRARPGALLALDEHLDAAFIADQAANSVGPSHASYEWDGHLWGLAIDAAGHVSAYRPDLLERLGCRTCPRPGTTLELDQAAPGRRASDLASEQSRSTRSARLLTLAANAGVEPYADEEQHRCRARSRSSSFEPSRAPRRDAQPASRSLEPDPAARAHGRGRRRRRCPILFSYSNYSRPGFRKSLVQFRPSRLPASGPAAASSAARASASPAHSQQREAACAYADYIASPEIQRALYVEAGGQPGHRSAWLDPAANELSPRFFERHAAGPRRGLPAPALRRRARRPERGRRHRLGVPAARRRRCIDLLDRLDDALPRARSRGAACLSPRRAARGRRSS